MKKWYNSAYREISEKANDTEKTSHGLFPRPVIFKL